MSGARQQPYADVRGCTRADCLERGAPPPPFRPAVFRSQSVMLQIFTNHPFGILPRLLYLDRRKFGPAPSVLKNEAPRVCENIVRVRIRTYVNQCRVPGDVFSGIRRFQIRRIHIRVNLCSQDTVRRIRIESRLATEDLGLGNRSRRHSVPSCKTLELLSLGVLICSVNSPLESRSFPSSALMPDARPVLKYGVINSSFGPGLISDESTGVAFESGMRSERTLMFQDSMLARVNGSIENAVLEMEPREFGTTHR